MIEKGTRETPDIKEYLKNHGIACRVIVTKTGYEFIYIDEGTNDYTRIVWSTKEPRYLVYKNRMSKTIYGFENLIHMLNINK